MSKIVFFCIPAHGHTNPTLGVVSELVSRGHEVWYYSYDLMRSKIEAAGARFVSCDDFDMERKLNPGDAARIGKDLAFSTRILVDTTLALDHKICTDMIRLRPDCIVADSMAVWGRAAARKLGIPFVSSTTTFAFNRYSARIMKRSVGEFLVMMLSMPEIDRQVKRLRAKGYPIKSILDILQNDDTVHTIVYTSPQFQPCAETFSDRYAFVGPSVRSASEEIGKIREKLVYLSMGTVNNDMLPFYKSCIAAFAGAEYQVILSVGNLTKISGLGGLPEHILVYSQVDQIAVLKKADVFVSHCGMNSVNESLYYGVPLVMLPVTSEQGGVAARVESLGAGIRVKRRNGKAVRNAVEQVLENPSYRSGAASIAEGFRKCPGALGAADKILAVCRNP